MKDIKYNRIEERDCKKVIREYYGGVVWPRAKRRSVLYNARDAFVKEVYIYIDMVYSCV